MFVALTGRPNWVPLPTAVATGMPHAGNGKPCCPVAERWSTRRATTGHNDPRARRRPNGRGTQCQW
eukprot:5876518-Lingulodinium_polyedra.AAC.1